MTDSDRPVFRPCLDAATAVNKYRDSLITEIEIRQNDFNGSLRFRVVLARLNDVVALLEKAFLHAAYELNTSDEDLV